MIVNILGTEYKIKDVERCEVNGVKILGVTDFETKEIQILKNGDLKNSTIRHEIIHAYLYESGLDSSSNEIDSWARNEEMVDWFAIQLPKIFKTFEQLKVID